MINEFLTGILQITPNEYSLSLQVDFGDSWQNASFSSKVIIVDSTGIPKRSFETTPSLEEVGCHNLHKTGEGFWAYTTFNVEYEFDGHRMNRARFILRDTAFNLLKEITFAPKGYDNNFFNMIPSQAGGKLILGGVIKEKNRAGWLVRLDESENILWQKKYLAIENASENQSNILVNAVELPSGNFIAVGHAADYLQPKNYGWLIKIDKKGCVDTLVCDSVSSNVLIADDANKILVFPNPGRDIIEFDFSSMGNRKIDRIIICDFSGRKIAELSPLPGNTSATWLTSNAPSGLYIYRIYSKNRILETGKIILNK